VVQQAVEQLKEFRQIILVGASAPVAFFAHPARPSIVTADGCEIHALSRSGEDESLDALAAALSASRTPFHAQTGERPSLQHGGLTLPGLAAAVGAMLPPSAIVIDESITSGRGIMAATRGAPPHDYLVNTGGSIGIGIPLAVGAAVACPGRPVLCLSGDGSAMYTLQGLWTAARENLAITTVVFANRTYEILMGELASLGTVPGRRALETLDIGRPNLDFVALAKGMGMRGVRVSTLQEFAGALKSAFESAEPNLIEVAL
jgi:acetolactate synthase-1/2/3 large subunit